MKDYRVLEDLIKTHIQAYETGYNQINSDYELKFNLTITKHKIDVQDVKKDVAYLRLERVLKPKGGTDAENEILLIYNQAYKFNSMAEQLDPAAPWRYALYSDVIGRLIGGGLEYSELISRAKQVQKNTEKLSDIVDPPKPDIVITDQMPAPLTEDEKNYRDYIAKTKKQ